MEKRKLIPFCIIGGLLVASFMITEIKNGFELKEVKAEPTGGNILYVGGGGPNNYTKIQDAIMNKNQRNIYMLIHA